MRFLANENFPRSAVEALRSDGHDVAWVRTEAPGATDEHVLRMSVQDDRTLLTFDKDFGELVLARGVHASRGVVLFRLSHGGPSDVAGRIASVIGTRADWANHFSVVEEERVRMRPLPSIEGAS